MIKARLSSKAELLKGMRKAEEALNKTAELLHRGNLSAAEKIQIRKTSVFTDAVMNAMILLLKTRRS